MKYFLNMKRDKIKALFKHFGIPYFRPAEEELIREYVKVMEPISEMLNVLKAEIKVSVGYFTLTVLLDKMKALKESGNIKHCKLVFLKIIDSIKLRFKDSFNDEKLEIAVNDSPFLQN